MRLHILQPLQVILRSLVVKIDLDRLCLVLAHLLRSVDGLTQPLLVDL